MNHKPSDSVILSWHVIEKVVRKDRRIEQFIVVSIPSIESMSYDEYESRGIPSEPQLRNLTLRARRLSRRLHFPFFDTALSICIAKDLSAGAIFDEVVRHNRVIDLARVSTTQNIADALVGISQAHHSTVVGVKSTVSLVGGGRAHIPMLDFHCPVTEVNLGNVKEILKRLGHSGYILNSGKSFHFIGDVLLDDDGFLRFIGKASLFAPYVDRAWIGHQLMQGACVLRVSSKPGRSGPPRLIDYVFR